MHTCISKRKKALIVKLLRGNKKKKMASTNIFQKTWGSFCTSPVFKYDDNLNIKQTSSLYI
ncbi:hypothetical protein HMPREF9065_00187 [Aggregatibacter sp. oral taxon 458 str. W10330]|nr:hypothetical protein HMPREF9065_00187 [Aggregatibacter sp. oral taxon 458 str. W10330]